MLSRFVALSAPLANPEEYHYCSYMEHLNSSDLQRTIAHFEAHDLGFTFPLRDEAYVLSQAPSSNWSNMDAWASFKAKVEMVKGSPALLGYYM